MHRFSSIRFSFLIETEIQIELLIYLFAERLSVLDLIVFAVKISRKLFNKKSPCGCYSREVARINPKLNSDLGQFIISFCSARKIPTTVSLRFLLTTSRANPDLQSLVSEPSSVILFGVHTQALSHMICAW